MLNWTPEVYFRSFLTFQSYIFSAFITIVTMCIWYTGGIAMRACVCNGQLQPCEVMTVSVARNPTVLYYKVYLKVCQPLLVYLCVGVYMCVYSCNVCTPQITLPYMVMVGDLER